MKELPRELIHCSNSWCGYKKDPEGYKHGSLPGGKDLTGEDLRATLEEAIRPFLSHDSVKKLAPAGSSQRNESVNSSIGSKAPKIRHYGGSQSSDFRTAAENCCILSYNRPIHRKNSLQDVIQRFLR